MPFQIKYLGSFKMDTLPKDIVLQIISSDLKFKDVLNFLKTCRTIYSTSQNDGFKGRLMVLWFKMLETCSFDKIVGKLIRLNKLDVIQIIIDKQYNLDRLLLLYVIHDRVDLLKEIMKSPVLEPDIKSKPTNPRIPSLSSLLTRPRVLTTTDIQSVTQPENSQTCGTTNHYDELSRLLGGPRKPKVYSVANPGSFKSESLNIACENRNVEMVKQLVKDNRVRINSDIIQSAIDIEDKFTFDIFSAIYLSPNWCDRHTREAYSIANGNGNVEIMEYIEECEGWGEEERD